MKNIIIKALAVAFALSLLMTAFTACGKGGKDDLTQTSDTEFVSDTQPSVSESQPENDATPVPDIVIRQALEEKGFEDWDGDYENLTDEMKAAASEYFAARGKELEFREDGPYLSNLGEDSSEPLSDDESTKADDGGQTQTGGQWSGSGSKPTGNQNVVGKKGVKVQSIALPGKGVTVAKNSTIKVDVTFTPANAENKNLDWKIKNTNIAKVDSKGNLTGVAEGLTELVCTSKENKNISASCQVAVGAPTGASLVSYQYDPDNKLFFTDDDPWQRNFGFNAVYDQAAPFTVMYMDTVRMKFRHDAQKLDYMIQFWKGQYGFVFVGCEIGVYTKPTSRKIEHYDCGTDEQALKMEMSMYQNGKWEFTRTYRTYWWPTGFIPGMLDRFADRSSLVMTARITLKDSQMTRAFVSAMKGQGFKQVNHTVTHKNYDQFQVKGNDVYVCWRYLNHPENPIQVLPKDEKPATTTKKVTTTTSPTTTPTTESTEPTTTPSTTLSES